MDRLQTRLLRALVLAATVLGVAAAILGFVPSVDVYEDSSDCFGRALSSLFAMHGGAGACESTWEPVATRSAAEQPAEMAAYFLTLVAPGLVVWRRPRAAYALAWTLFAMVATFAMIVLTFELFGGWGVRTVERWPAQLYGAVSSALLIELIVVIPLACVVLAIVARLRPRPPALPEARVVR